MQSLFQFEQAILDAAAQAKAEALRKEQSEKLSRRLAREAAYRAKHPPGHAQCGIRWTTIREANSPLGASILWRAWEANPAGSGWTHCHDCGQPLIYTADPNAQPQVCHGRRP